MFTAHLTYNNKTLNIHPNKSTIVDELYVMFTTEENKKYTRIRLDIHPKQDVSIQDLEIQFKASFDSKSRVFCNGYQSSSESRLYTFDEIPDVLKWFSKPFVHTYEGDSHISFIPRKKGSLHSWTYGYFIENQDITSDNPPINFIGSLNETTAFTCFIFDSATQTIKIKKDMGGLLLSHSFPAVDIMIMKGDTPSVFDTYFELSEIKKPKAPHMVGWSSSFNYKNNISENIILDNLQNFKIKKLKVDFIQIDDGWQSNVGDWLTPNNTFQKGMSYLAYAIHEQGVKAGLWLAPFIVEKESTIFKNKKNWLLTDNNGNPIIIGKSKQWSGEFYALDFYNKEVQEHMTGIVYTILNKWGFDFIKFDYLYAVCATHPPQKTRGQIMHDTMVFLRNLCGDKWMISSKVPLGSAFGLTDYCQVCSNIHTSWENNLDSFLQVRERASTISALRSLLNRWQLNGRAFQNTDNVFIINNKNHKLKDNQVETLSSLNGLLSSLSTTSDWAKYYEDDNIENYNAHFNYKNCQINHIQLRGDDLYEIIFTNDGIKQVCIVNLSNKKVNYRNLELDPFKTLFDDF